MRRIFLVAMIAAFVGGTALPVGAVPASTLPLTVDCDDRGTLTFDLILADASIVGFELGTGKPVVFHGVAGEFVDTLEVGEDVYTAEFPESFVGGKGKGLKLTECVTDGAAEVYSDTFTVDDETAAIIFDEFEVEVAPGTVVTLTGTFEGTAMVQFPGR